MNEPEAWEPSELERALLEAAQHDHVNAELSARIGSALSAGGLTAGSAAGAAAKGGLLFSKAGLWGALSIAVLAGAGALYTAGTPQRAEPVSAPIASDANESAAEPPPAPAKLAGAAEPPAPPLAVAPKPQRAPEPESAGALRDEIELLDRAREALERAALRTALSALEQHRRRFPSGALIPEAEAMRIEALARLGEGARAERLSRRFLATHPAHPMRERVRALIEGPLPDPP